MEKILFVVAMIVSMFSFVVNAFAVDTTVSDLFNAAGISGISTGVGVILLAGIAIAVLFTGYKLVKRVLRRF